MEAAALSAKLKKLALEQTQLLEDLKAECEINKSRVRKQLEDARSGELHGLVATVPGLKYTKTTDPQLGTILHVFVTPDVEITLYPTHVIINNLPLEPANFTRIVDKASKFPNGIEGLLIFIGAFRAILDI